jgi:hypothetical protein
MESNDQFELVVTSVLPIGECLKLVAEAGLTTNSIEIRFITGKYQQQTAELLIKYLIESFGWLEMERLKSVETLRGRNKYGLIESYQSQVCKVFMEKHGAIRRF